MMNKLLAKTTKKLTLISLAMALVVVLAVIFTAIFGVNAAAKIDDQTTLTVKMSSVYYRNEKNLKKIEAICEKQFETDNLNVLYVYRGAMSGDECELMYVFKKDTNVSNTKEALQVAFDKDYSDAFISVEQGNEVVKSAVPSVYVIRAAVAVIVFALVAFIYTLLRHGLYPAILVSAAILSAVVLSAAVILLVRIPVTSSAIYACVISALIAPVFVLMGLNKFRADETEDELEEKVVRNVAGNEMVTFAAVLGGALVLVGAIATWPVRWFALCALLGLAASTAVVLFLIPALQLPLFLKKQEADEARTKSGYVGAKKVNDNEN